jgi:hypothetical protein
VWVRRRRRRRAHGRKEEAGWMEEGIIDMKELWCKKNLESFKAIMKVFSL